MDDEMDHLLTLIVEPPSRGWRLCMRMRHHIPEWTFPFFADKFNDRFRNAEIYNLRGMFSKYAHSPSHLAFMKFWVAKTIEVFNWSNFLEWSKISHISINGISPELMCPLCQRQVRPCSEGSEWRHRRYAGRRKPDNR